MQAKNIHETELVDCMVSCIWDEVKKSGRPIDFWGKNPDEAASFAYGFFERDHWKGLLEKEVISKVSAKFSSLLNHINN